MAEIESSDLSKSFGSTVALHNVNFSLSSGEILTVLGQNGAGKSTLLRLIAGIERADSGELSVAGYNLVNTSELRKFRLQVGVGYGGTELLLYPQLTVKENLRLFAQLLGVDSGQEEKVIQSFSLGEVLSKKVNALSRGWAKRASLARAFLGMPALLVLDEPFSNLDAEGRELLASEILSSHGQGSSIVVASHNREWLEQKTGSTLKLKRGFVVSEEAK